MTFLFGHGRRLGTTLVLFLVLGTCAIAWAQPKSPPASASQPVAKKPADKEDYSTFIGKLKAAGWVGHTIIVLSVIAMGLAIDHMLTIRAKKLMPPGLADQVRQLIQAGNAKKAYELCQQHPSVLANVLSAGLSEADGGWPAVEKAMEDTVAEESARLYRRIEYLSVIGNVAPMLGLLGTVIGMIDAFEQVAETQGVARAADLAQGIYLALVTTVQGLVVAIPTLGAFAIFRNRVDQLIAEVAYQAQHTFSPLRRVRSQTRTAATAPPPVEGRG